MFDELARCPYCALPESASKHRLLCPAVRDTFHPVVELPKENLMPPHLDTTGIAAHPLTEFEKILTEIQEMHDKKSADYGAEGDPFANVRASIDFGIPGWVGCMTRANDKMKRIQKAAKGDALTNESLEDSLMDLAVYSIIALVLVREGTGVASEHES